MAIRIPSNEVYLKIWEVKELNGRLVGKGTTSEKDLNGEYRNSSWDLAFGNKCRDEAAKLMRGDMIVVTAGKIDCAPYVDKDGNKKYPNARFGIWNFHKWERQPVAPDGVESRY